MESTKTSKKKCCTLVDEQVKSTLYTTNFAIMMEVMKELVGELLLSPLGL
jgi:hypothetical protein